MITSLLDNDLYQFTMAQHVWKHRQVTKREVIVQYELTNRSAQRIRYTLEEDSKQPKVFNDAPEELIAQVNELFNLKFTSEELDYLESLGYFEAGFLGWLEQAPSKFPDVQVDVIDGQLTLDYAGDWEAAIFLETPLLALITEIHSKLTALYGTPRTYFMGAQRLMSKVQRLRETQLPFVEFGTRRRYSRAWQENVLTTILRENTGLAGTSNLHLARHYGLKPVGTMAHQLFMVEGSLQLYDKGDLFSAYESIFSMWASMYKDHPELLAVLPDTFTTEHWFAWPGAPAVAREWSAFRQDSGNPFDWARRLAAWLREHEINPQDKRVIFSDGLTLPKMEALYAEFQPVFGGVVFGWGTDLTNDTGTEPLSLVIKPVGASSGWLGPVGVAKLSDDPAKVTGYPGVAADIAESVKLGIDKANAVV